MEGRGRGRGGEGRGGLTEGRGGEGEGKEWERRGREMEGWGTGRQELIDVDLLHVVITYNICSYACPHPPRHTHPVTHT